MAVSALEAESALAASRYLAASRTAASRELVERAGVAFCRERHVVPLRREGRGVLVATAYPGDRATLRELERSLGEPLVVRAGGRGEIRIAIDSATGTPAGQARRRALADLLEALSIVSARQSAAYALAAEQERYLGEALVEAGLLTEEERLEAVGLAFHLPSVDLAEHPPKRDLEALLDPATLRELRVLPLWAVRHELFVAVDDPPTADAMSRLERDLGTLVRPVLAGPRALAARIEALPGDRPAEPPDLGDALRSEGVVSARRFTTAVEVAAGTGESVQRAVERLYDVPPERIEAAVARRANIERYRGIDSVDPAAVSAVPEAMARRMQVAAVARARGEVSVAMADPWDGRARRGLAALLDARIRPLLASAEDVAAILDRHGDGGRADVLPPGDPLRTSVLLLQAGFVDRESAALADIEIERLNEVALPRMWRMLENGKRSEAVALDAGLPRVHALLLHPDPQAAALRPPGGERPAVQPLLLDGDVLTVAVASPDDAGAARALASAHGHALRLAVTREDDLDAARGRLSTLDLRTIGPRRTEFGRLLERRYGLGRAEVLELLQRAQEHAEPLDVAAQRLHLLTPERLRDAFAAYLGAEPVTLRRDDRLESTRDRTGASVTRRVLADPVDHALARMLTPRQCERLGALPLRRDGGSLLVAMADLLDEDAREALRDALGESFEVRPATRGDIREASLRAHGRPAIGDRLLDSGAVDSGDVRRALELAERSGVRVGEALRSLGSVSEEQLDEELASQRGIPFYTLRGMELQPGVAALLPEEFARAHAILPISVDSRGVVTLAAADPTDRDAIEEARALVGRETALVGTTRSDIRDALERLYHRDYLDHSAAELMRRFPGDSAHAVLSRGQRYFFVALLAVLGGSLVAWTIPTLVALMALATLFYVTFSVYKFYLIYRALSHTLEVPLNDAEIAAVDDRDLPVYTILVPLYREAEVLPTLVAALARLDYPMEKLDVKLLLEEDDPETIFAARSANLPPFIDITIVPHGMPKGKPKACNYGLLHARGEYVVIFDAEDIPDRDQLKKALAAFRNSPDNVVCIQAKLNYYNRDQNALTKWFTTEYSTWFDLFLPGLDASGAPIPLGGTSNHFKIDALREAGAWDPYNVTEDADLGLRIFKRGGRTAVVDSTTFEEANSVLDNWIRQRSRWVKGYIQTYLVHMRNPWRTFRQLGPGGFLSFQLVVGGTLFGFLLNPLLWALTALWFVTQWGVLQQLFPGPIYYMGAISLYAGNFAFAYMNVAGCLQRRYYTLVKWALLSPVYWVLMSIAAWKGFLQLFYRPHYWEKTVHGLSDVSGLAVIERAVGD